MVGIFNCHEQPEVKTAKKIVYSLFCRADELKAEKEARRKEVLLQTVVLMNSSFQTLLLL